MNRILLIEDNEDSIRLLQDSLLKIGYTSKQLLVCRWIKEFENLKEELFEFILCNLQLPDSDGVSTFETVNRRFPDTPIIVLSSVADEDLALKLLKQGAEDYLIKGEFSLNLLRKSIVFAIQRKERSNIYNAVFEGSPIPMFVFELENYQILAVNNASIKQYGYSRKEFRSMTLQHIRVSEEAQIKLNLHRNKFESTATKGKYLHKKKDGTLFYVNVYTHEISFQRKRAILVFAIDVDNKVQAQLLAEQRSKEIESILGSMTDCFITIDRNWIMTYANPIAEKIAQKSVDMMVGRSVWDMFPEALKLKFYDEYSYALNNNESRHFEEYYPAMGRWFAVNAYPYKDGLAVYLADITERKKLEHKIHISEQNLSATINNTRDIIWSMNHDLEIITANENFWNRVAEISGKQKHEVTAADFKPELLENWSAWFQRAFAGESFKTIFQSTVKEQLIYEEISFNPIRNLNGEITGVSCYSRDITEQQKHLRLIEEQNEQLKKISWMQSHEVRKPLANIMGLINILDVQHLNPENAEKIDLIKMSAEELDTLVKQISYLSCSI